MSCLAVLESIELPKEPSTPYACRESEVARMPYLGPGKLVRITEDAHRTAKVAAALAGKTMEQWVSEVITQRASSVRSVTSPRGKQATRRR